MRCSNISECFEQISAYFDGKKTGHFLLVNSENYDGYQEILQRLEADSSKKRVYISQNCLPNGLPMSMQPSLLQAQWKLCLSWAIAGTDASQR